MPLAGVRAGQPSMKMTGGREQATLMQPTSLQGLPSGFMPLNRQNIRPLMPSKGSAVIGSVHMIPKKEQAAPAVILDEHSDETAMSVLGSAEREVASIPAFRNAVRNVGAKLHHAWPLPQQAEQRFSSPFGMRRDPFTQQHAFHEGIDVAVDAGTPVLASADGMVKTVTRGKEFGKYVIVKHRDGTATTYGHLSAQSVHEGQPVKQGQKLGEVGSTGRSTAAHLHFQIEENGKPVNPLASLTPPWNRAIGVAMREISQ
jgi:murein DD-endopeptidase MepM/ murein hydrolase activator NlpD